MTGLNQTDDERRAYWKAYYETVTPVTGDESDYPTHRMHHESLAIAVKCGGQVEGAHVLDAGCGGGQLLAMAKLLGAERCVGFDFDPPLIKRAEKRWGDAGVDIEFHVADMGDDAEWPFRADTFDLVWSVEAMHCVPVGDAIHRLWRLVRPGGRLVAIVTNADSPINDVANWRHGGVGYFGLGMVGINPLMRRLQGIATHRIMGLHFADDQRAEVYDSTRLFVTDPAPYSWVLTLVKAG